MSEKLLAYLNMKILCELAVILVLLLISFKIVNIFDSKIRKHIVNSSNNLKLLGLVPLFNKVLKVLILLIALATILQDYGFSITTLVACFGVTGLAIGFAAKETIANLFGSISILLDQVYNIGDYVIIGNEEGNIEDINLRSTKIRTPQQTLVTIPNNIVANSFVENISAVKNSCIDETFAIAYNTNIDKINLALTILKEIASNHPDVNSNFDVFVKKFDNTSIKIKFLAYTNMSDLKNIRRIKEEIMLSVLERFRTENIEFAPN